MQFVSPQYSGVCLSFCHCKVSSHFVCTHIHLSLWENSGLWIKIISSVRRQIRNLKWMQLAWSFRAVLHWEQYIKKKNSQGKTVWSLIGNSVLVLVSVCEPLTSFSIDKIVLAVVSAHQNPLHVRLHVLQWNSPHLPILVTKNSKLSLRAAYWLHASLHANKTWLCRG